MSEFDILRAAAAGMDAQRSALDLAARNVAAASATQDGAPFARLIPRFAVAPDPAAAGPDGYEPPSDPEGALFEEAGTEPDGAFDAGSDADDVPVRYLGARPQPGTGVDAITEMVAVLGAQRAYEADASVFDLGKRLAERTIDAGRLP